ncbi:MAG: CaiB/BaiF CoA-transferase family protein [Pseudomonadota bacterium]
MGPLAGTKVIEIKGIGPGPYAAMLLADLGADVTVVERSSSFSGLGIPPQMDVTSRGKKSIALDVKHPDGLATLLQLIAKADVLIEGFRPGVAERLGFGPDACHAINPGLVFARLTGWGQTGPLSSAAGHDINYLSIVGVLAAIGGKDAPVPPLNLVGDYAGGSLFLVVGVLAALLERQRSGQGQVIDAAIVDGAAHMMSPFYGWRNAGAWQLEREANIIDGGAYFYGVFETKDAKFVSIGPLEPQFYQQFVDTAGLDKAVFGSQLPPTEWPRLKQQLADEFRKKTQHEWAALLEGTDCCFAPVLDLEACTGHPHNVARDTYIDLNGHKQPAPAPRFSRTPCPTPEAPKPAGNDADEVLAAIGVSDDEIRRLRENGALT